MAELTLKEAFATVLDLAHGNVLDDFDISFDPEILKPIQAEQEKSIEMVTAYSRANADDFEEMARELKED